MNAEPTTTNAALRAWLFRVAGIASMPGTLVAAFIAFQNANIAQLATNQPGCDASAYVAMVWLFGPLAVLCAAMTVAYLGRGRLIRSIVCAVLLVATAVPITSTIADNSLREMKGIRTLISSRMRSIWHARQAAEADGIKHAATVLLLLQLRYITPEIVISPAYTCPVCPPMPDPTVFNYNGITMDDALQGRISRQEIIDAANAVLGDEPWERIGWTWYLRDGRPYQPGADPAIIVGGGILYTRVMTAMVLRADGSVWVWSSTDPDLADKLSAAIAAAEAAGVASPPEELVSFVRESTGAMKRR